MVFVLQGVADDSKYGQEGNMSGKKNELFEILYYVILPVFLDPNTSFPSPYNV